MNKTYQSPASKPVFAAIAVAATVATLGLAVVGPVALSPASTASAQVASSTAAGPTQVAILPGTIQVVGKRTKVARVDSPYLPARYNVR